MSERDGPAWIERARAGWPWRGSERPPYGGWITKEIVGPWKGEAGTSGW